MRRVRFRCRGGVGPRSRNGWAPPPPEDIARTPTSTPAVLWGSRVGGGGVVSWCDTVERLGRRVARANAVGVGLRAPPCCWIGWEGSPSSGGLGARGRLRRPVRRRGRARRATATWSLSTGGEDRDGDTVGSDSARAAGLPMNGVLSTALMGGVGQGEGDASTEGGGDVPCQSAPPGSKEAALWRLFFSNAPPSGAPAG